MGITFRSGDYLRFVRVGRRTIKDGEAAVIWNRKGEHTQVIGPARVWLFYSTVRFLTRFRAEANQYLQIKHRDGRVEHVQGPTSVYLNPNWHDDITVKEGIQNQVAGVNETSNCIAPANTSGQEKTVTAVDTVKDDSECGRRERNEALNGGGTIVGLSSILGEQADKSTPMLQATKAGLDVYDLRYELLPLPDTPQANLISFGFRSRICGNTKVVCIVEEQEDKFIYLTKLPTIVPEEHRGKVALFLTRVNYGMSLGNFELDLEDGEIRYKCSCKTMDSKLSVEMVKFTVALSVQMVDKFFPGVMGVVYGGKGPKEAYDDCMRDREQAEDSSQRGPAQ